MSFSSTCLNADITSLADPLMRDINTESIRDPNRIERCSAAVLIDVRGETSMMVRIAHEKDGTDGIEGCACNPGHCIDCRGSALRVALKDETFIRICLESGRNLVDDLLRLVSLHILGRH